MRCMVDVRVQVQHCTARPAAGVRKAMHGRLLVVSQSLSESIRRLMTHDCDID
jgi:hypothetical protein